ncbi:hypothetical protein [Halobellus marinus]|uniref:hypothetical protein n=1 Tax=Halobellus TaxID=1073986 RepID=UPI0028AE89E0|nr:hypothetical protein [Halobellus sp. DFY28]
MQRDRNSGKALDDHGIPGPLDNAVAATLDAYDENPGRKGRDELREAVARIHHAFQRDFHELDTTGPVAYYNGMLVYVLPLPEWENLCTDREIWANARSWTHRIYLHAARRVAESDPTVAFDHARDQYQGEDRRVVVVEHP